MKIGDDVIIIYPRYGVEKYNQTGVIVEIDYLTEKHINNEVVYRVKTDGISSNYLESDLRKLYNESEETN